MGVEESDWRSTGMVDSLLYKYKYGGWLCLGEVV